MIPSVEMHFLRERMGLARFTANAARDRKEMKQLEFGFESNDEAVDEFGLKFLADSHGELLKSADRYFGAIMIFCIALATTGWAEGVVSARGIFLLGFYCTINLLISAYSR